MKNTADFTGVKYRTRFIDKHLRMARRAMIKATRDAGEETLRELDPELFQRIKEQEELFIASFKIGAREIELQTAAMCRGWDAMAERIDQAFATGEIDFRTGVFVARDGRKMIV